MKIPKEIKVLDHTYKVYIDSTNDSKKGKNNWSLTNHEHQEIHIDSGVEGTLRDEIFIHEVLHIITLFSGLSDDFDAGVAMSDEQVVNRLAPILTNVLKNNKLQ